LLTSSIQYAWAVPFFRPSREESGSGSRVRREASGGDHGAAGEGAGLL